jgi:quercetin dioxygenase-like cupin family protein
MARQGEAGAGASPDDARNGIQRARERDMVDQDRSAHQDEGGRGAARPRTQGRSRRAVAIVAAATVATASGLAPGARGMPMVDSSRAASAPSGVHITPLSSGTIAGRAHADSQGVRISTRRPAAMLVTAITVDPGGSFGWHTHPGPVLVTVGSGTLTVYDAMHGHCAKSAVHAGDAFIEDGGHVHLARNEGSQPVQLNATFLGRPGTKEFLRPAPRPDGCPA